MKVIDSDRSLGDVVYRTWRCPNCGKELSTEEKALLQMTRRARKYVRDLLKPPKA